MNQHLKVLFTTGVGFLVLPPFTGCQSGSSSANNYLIDSAAVYQAYKTGHLDQTEKSAVSILKLLHDNNAKTGDGEPVLIADAQPCLDAYHTLMNRLGFPDIDPNNKPAGYPGRISLSEDFKGDNLITWLGQVKQNGATEIRLEFGRYTDSFLKKRFSNDSDPADLHDRRIRSGRLAIFIYPFDRNGNTVGNLAYDLGNIKPSN